MSDRICPADEANLRLRLDCRRLALRLLSLGVMRTVRRGCTRDDRDDLQRQVEEARGYHRPAVRKVKPGELVRALELLCLVHRDGQLSGLLERLDERQRLAVRFSIVEASEAIALLEDADA